MIDFFHTILYTPIYNLLVFLTGVLPGGDLGLAVVIVTIVVKLVVMPFSLAAIRTQRAMKAIEPELLALKEQHKDDKEAQAKETFALYRKYRINPFASFFTLLIQLPILLCLYWVFRTEHLPAADPALLYSFVHLPAVISTSFLGLFPVAGKSLALALVAGVTQFFQAKFAIPTPPPSTSEKPSMQEELGRAMAMQARYVLPFVIALVAYASGAIALYFITSNAIAVMQELFVRRTHKPLSAAEEK